MSYNKTLPSGNLDDKGCVNTSFLFTDQEEDLLEMKQSAERMDECYGHWVDYILVKEDPVSALAELQVLVERVQMEPQWVPVSWVRS